MAQGAFSDKREVRQGYDSSTWTTFEACRAAYNRGGFDGIGFVFDGEVGDDGLCYVGVDFDRCIEDGKLLEPARSRIARLQTYTEVSVSGTGIHCIARAKPGATVKYTLRPKVVTRSRSTAMGGTSPSPARRSAKPAAPSEPPPQKWMRSSKKRGRRSDAKVLSPLARSGLQSSRTYSSIPQ